METTTQIMIQKLTDVEKRLGELRTTTKLPLYKAAEITECVVLIKEVRSTLCLPKEEKVIA